MFVLPTDGIRAQKTVYALTPSNMEIYEHYKGKRYEFIGVAHHSETLEELVVYRALYHSDEFGDNPLWVRPKAMFFENVTIDGKEVPRFRKVDEA